MASGRYNGQPSVQRAQRLIVNEAGEFSAPVSLYDREYESMLGGYEEMPSSQPSFVFDDDLSWDQSIGSLPVSAQAAPPRQSAPQRRPQQPYPQRGHREDRRSRRGWRAYLYVAVICVSLAGMLVLGVMMMPQLTGYFWKDFPNLAFINGELLRYDAQNVATYKQYRSYMDRDVIYPGVFIDGIHVGDMTVDEARAALSSAGGDLPGAFSVTVAIGNKTWTVDPGNVPATRDLGNVLEKAYAIGHQHHGHPYHAAHALSRARGCGNGAAPERREPDHHRQLRS